jgi:hypothetical protein
MKFIATLLVLMSFSVFSNTYKLDCEYEYETYSSDDELYGHLIMEGVEEDGKVIFSSSKSILPTYFFPAYGPAIWHRDAKIQFEGELVGDQMTFRFVFENYKRSLEDYGVLYDVTRTVKLDELFEEDEDDFDYNDGDVIESYINKDPWINEKGVALEECELTIE